MRGYKKSQNGSNIHRLVAEEHQSSPGTGFDLKKRERTVKIYF
jgi:hypothetical protein